MTVDGINDGQQGDDDTATPDGIPLIGAGVRFRLVGHLRPSAVAAAGKTLRQKFELVKVHPPLGDFLSNVPIELVIEFRLKPPALGSKWDDPLEQAASLARLMVDRSKSHQVEPVEDDPNELAIEFPATEMSVAPEKAPLPVDPKPKPTARQKLPELLAPSEPKLQRVQSPVGSEAKPSESHVIVQAPACLQPSSNTPQDQPETVVQQPRRRRRWRSSKASSPGSTASVAGSGNVDPLAALCPSLGIYSDLRFIDQTRLPFFEVVCRTHALFKNVASWPLLADLAKQAKLPPWDEAECATLLHPALRARQGVVYQSQAAGHWAVRLLPDAGNSGGFLAVGFQLETVNMHARQPKGNLQAGQSAAPVILLTADEMRKQLGDAAKCLRLYQTEQLVWMLHSAMLGQQRSKVVLADIACARAIWGLGKWPQNWRRDLYEALRTLLCIRWTRLPDAATLFAAFPLIAQAVDGRILAGLTDDLRSKQRPVQCPDGCPLLDSGEPHHHFLVALAPAFMGGLLQFHTGKLATGGVGFDFYPDFKDRRQQAREEVNQDFGSALPGRKQALQKKLQAIDDQRGTMYQNLVTMPLATMVLGSLAGISDEHRTILRALVRETTRAVKASQQARDDKAFVITGARVAGSNPKNTVTCPLLQAGEKYVGFNGNSKVWGIGYRVQTWMHRCGFLADATQIPSLKAIRSFLTVVGQLSQTHDLIIVSLFDGVWYDHAQLLQLDTKTLAKLTLRFYAPADYADRWRSYLAQEIAKTKPPDKVSKGPEPGEEQDAGEAPLSPGDESASEGDRPPDGPVMEG